MIPKARIWDKKEKRMITSLQEVRRILSEILTAIVRDNAGRDLLDRYVVMLATGMEDITGKEIFEDDIVEDNNGYRNFLKYGDFYDHDYTCPVAKGYDHVGVGGVNPSKIIGNKWENPELLEDI